jgi:beta-lactamase regulating signal transducer with metallopeptidase domain
MIAGLLDHLWQSSVFAAACAALTLGFAANGAAMRFWLWFAASIKFLLPFALLTAAGTYMSGLFPHLTPPPRLLMIQPVAQRLADPVHALTAGHPPALSWTPWLAGLWLAGVALVLAVQLARGVRLKAALADTSELALDAPVPVKATAARLEPGLVGIFKPVILFPAGLLDRLSGAQVDAILAHESAHWARHDNLTAALHMVVEALFWFHPLVWLIGSRLIAERERACDETVLARGHDAQVYAEGILQACRFCLPLPLACGAGGGALSARVEHIMIGGPGRDVGHVQQLLLGTCVLASLALPVAGGFVASPLVTAVKARVVAVQAEAQQVIADSVTAVTQQIAAPVTHVEVRRLPRLKVAIAPVAAPPVVEAPKPDAVQVADVQPAAPAPLTLATPPAPQVIHASLALDPRGEGDPEAITCRLPQTLPGSHLPGPMVCKLNRLWAELRVNHAVISADGSQVEIPSDGERHRSLNATSCDFARATGGASASITGLPLNFCF